MKINLAQYLLDYLSNKGITDVFGIPGRENADIAFNENTSINYITARIEFNAGVMADAAARITNKPQVAFCTLGPGATNMVTACAGAYASFSPMLLVSAQVEQNILNYNKTHQCVNQQHIFESITKWSYELQSSTEFPEVLDKAFNLMMTEPKGPVHLSIPVNLFHEFIENDILARNDKFNLDFARKLNQKRIDLLNEDVFKQNIEQAISIIKSNANILCLVGNEAIRANAQDSIAKFCEDFNIPLLSSANAYGVLPYEHKLNLGSGSCYMDGILESPNCLDKIMNDIDVILNIGYQCADDIPPIVWKRGKDKIIIDISLVGEYHFLYNPTVKIKADISDIMNLLNDKLSNSMKPKQDYINDACNWLKDLKHEICHTPLNNGFIGASDVVHVINKTLDENGALISDIGYYRHHAILFGKFKRSQIFLVDAALSSFGFGLPSAVATKIMYPQKEVFMICGDGGFHSGSGDLETVARYNLPMVILVLNNSSFDLIDRYQKKGNKDNPEILKFAPVDFAKLAEANGIKGVKVSNVEDLELAIKNRDTSKPILIEVPLQYHDQKFIESF
jgi:thiamine pyrophosphate-dependent acetolactate synthase large subunit-like protein